MAFSERDESDLLLLHHAPIYQQCHVHNSLSLSTTWKTKKSFLNNVRNQRDVRLRRALRGAPSVRHNAERGDSAGHARSLVHLDILGLGTLWH